jgi:succinyl-CoA synthetase beta subunit
MNLLEYQGKELLKKYAIFVPNSFLMSYKNLPLKASKGSFSLSFPLILKSQVATGNRKKSGGIIEIKSHDDLSSSSKKMFQTKIDGLLPTELLAEEKINYQTEIYISFSYDTEKRSPVLSLSKKGGAGVNDACIFPINLIIGLQDFFIRDSLLSAGLPLNEELKNTVKKLWQLFQTENALIAEINPLFLTKDGQCIAGDAKISLDDNYHNPSGRPFLDLPGDIAVIASGGGASMLNIDTLLKAGGKPANYTEYSGNPPAHIVKDLTIKILSKPGLKGCWVVGGTANFTDIYETMSGFIQGLKEIKPRPQFPIVIRRDGPRQAEAFAMLHEAAKNEGFNFSLFGAETSMSESAHHLVKKVSSKILKEKVKKK